MVDRAGQKGPWLVIVEKLNELYQGQAKSEPFRFRPSGLGDCARKQAFLLSGMEPFPPSPESLRVFELGHQRGEALERAAMEAWPDARSQVPVRISHGKLELSGTCDLWIPSIRTVVDFKTVGGYGAGMLSTEGVSLDYQLQVHAYRAGMVEAERSDWKGDPFEEEPPVGAEEIRCLIVYECKDSDSRKGIRAGQLIELEVPWTEELEAKYQDRLNQLERLAILKEIGQLDPYKVEGLPADSWKCRNGKDGLPLYCSIGSERGRCHELQRTASTKGPTG